MKFPLLLKERFTADEQFEEEQLSDYHLYSLGRTTTINDKEQKQIGLLTAEEIKVDKKYEYIGGGKVGVYLSFENSEKNNLGQPLPEGKIKFFKPDSSNQLQFLGESNIRNIPVNEKVKDLYIGNAFDIVVKEKIIEQSTDRNVYEITTEYTISNRKEESVSVDIPFFMGPNATIKLLDFNMGVGLLTPSADRNIIQAFVEANSSKVFKVYYRQENR